MSVKVQVPWALHSSCCGQVSEKGSTLIQQARRTRQRKNTYIFQNNQEESIQIDMCMYRVQCTWMLLHCRKDCIKLWKVSSIKTRIDVESHTNGTRRALPERTAVASLKLLKSAAALG